MSILLDHLISAQSWVIAQAAAVTPASDVAVGAPGNGALGHGLIYTVIIGLVIGAIAKFLTPGRDPGGCIITMLIGIAGSFVAYFLGRLLNIYGQGDTPGIIASIIGAVILLAIYHFAISRRTTRL